MIQKEGRKTKDPSDEEKLESVLMFFCVELIFGNISNNNADILQLSGHSNSLLPKVVPASGRDTDETMTKPNPSFSPRRISTS